MKKIAFITGATSGIGASCATRFAQEGYTLILTGRRKDRLEAIARALNEDYLAECHLLNFDVRDRKACTKAWESLPTDLRKVDVLINNAGLAAGRASIQDGDVDDWETMIDTNVKGLLFISRLIMPEMVKRNSGHIINISSIAGKEVYPEGNVYCATKFAVDAISKAMRIDMVKHNVRVTAINPGLVETEFSMVRFKGDEKKADAVYKGLEPLIADDIAEVVWFAASQPPHVCLNDITLTCTAQANASIVIRE